MDEVLVQDIDKWKGVDRGIVVEIEQDLNYTYGFYSEYEYKINTCKCSDYHLYF